MSLPSGVTGPRRRRRSARSVHHLGGGGVRVLCGRRSLPTRLPTTTQGLTLVQFSAQRKRCLWDRECIWGLFRGCLGGVGGC